MSLFGQSDWFHIAERSPEAKALVEVVDHSCVFPAELSTPARKLNQTSIAVERIANDVDAPRVSIRNHRDETGLSPLMAPIPVQGKLSGDGERSKRSLIVLSY